MPSRPRRETINPHEVGVYHCWSRCVRRAFLCGVDPYTGNDYEYRRTWIQEFQETLAALFAIEIGFRAELSNHLHLVLRNRPDVAKTVPDEEVVRRWLQITRLAKSKTGEVQEIPQEQITAQSANADNVEKYRERLADPSWFMATLNEYVARRSNSEDGVSGTFWEDRFGARALTCEASVLICGIYVDLNQIRAGEASNPETSQHTSAHDRIVGHRQRQQADYDPRQVCDGWMAELTLDERARPGDPRHVGSATGRRASDKGMVPISFEEYLQLLDETGRIVRGDKQGSISDEMAPILTRLGIKPKAWIDTVTHFHEWFGHIVGTTQELLQRGRDAGRQWYRGQTHCRAVFD